MQPVLIVGQAGMLHAHSKPSRVISTARPVSWPSLAPHLQRYIIQRNDGLIQVKPRSQPFLRLAHLRGINVAKGDRLGAVPVQP